MALDVLNLDRALVWLFVPVVLWLTVGTIINACIIGLRGESRRKILPRWARASAVSLAALVSLPRVAAASSSVVSQGTEPEGRDPSRGIDPILVGSLAANAGFAAFHVRRQLVRLRQTKFLSDESDLNVVERDVPVTLLKEPDWKFVVRVLGAPMVESADGKTVHFEKGKALELVVWMVEHRENSTRSAARTALWDSEVKDATFSNVVSESRRALQSVEPLVDAEWIPRTFTDELPLHPGVITDYQLLDIAFQNFRCDPDAAYRNLAKELGHVRNLPFSGANYGWADGEGITTSHVIRVVEAAVSLAEYAIHCDDNSLLFAATERGLRVLPGHEQLVLLRMKGHARSGNRSAIKFEWESYARAVEADSWAGAEPSPELEQLAHELSRSSH